MASQRCGFCGKESPPGARFCIHCGSLLTAPDSQEITDIPQEVLDEIHSLRDLVAKITERLDALERKGEAPVTPSSIPAQEPAPPVDVPEVTPPIPETIYEQPPVTIPSEPFPTIEPVPEPVSVSEVEEQPSREDVVMKEPREWEQILGGSWLARIGVLAIIIGIGFFLKYAFDNNWLGPGARVVLGIIAGLFMLGLGYYWRNRYPIMTQVLSGGGIAVLYLSIFAAFAMYDLISIYLAIALLLLVSIFSAILALRYNSMALAIIGIFGAFFAPFILGAFSERVTGEGGTGRAVQLLAYIIVVDLGVLLLSTFRNWRWFLLLALGCSLLTFGVWYAEFHRQISTVTAEIGITIIFLIFVGATSLFHFIQRHVPTFFDFILITINAAAYFGISYSLLRDDFRAWLGPLVFLLALFYGGISYIAYRRNPVSPWLNKFALAIALVFFTIAIPVQIGDRVWLTIAWSAEAVVLMWLFFRTNDTFFRICGRLVFIAVAIRLLAFDTTMDMATFQPVFNERFLAFIVSIAAMGYVTFRLWQRREEDEDSEYLAFLAMTNFFILWIIGVEVFNYSSQEMTVASSLSLLILLALAGVTVLYHLFWRREPEDIDIGLVVFNACAFIVISIFIWGDLRAWMGLLYFVLAAFYGILSYTVLRRGGKSMLLGSCSLGIAVLFFTVAVAIQLQDTVWTTIVWAIEGAVLMLLSFLLHRFELRYYCYIVFLAMTVRLLFLDTIINIATFQPVINERFLAFVISIAAVYFTVYLLWRQRDTLPEWRTVGPVLLIAASFFTLWIISFEVWHSFSANLRTAEQSARQGLMNAQNLSLTAVWAIYAVIGLVIGFVKHWRYVRLGCLALLAVPILKVFVYDVFKLEMSYRIGAFVGLGVLLLVSAYLYQRYSNVIREAFTEK